MLLKQSSRMPKLLLVTQTYILCPSLCKFLIHTSKNSLLFSAFYLIHTLLPSQSLYSSKFFHKMYNNWNFIIASSLFYTICFVSSLPAPLESCCYCRIYFCQKSFTVVFVYLIKLICWQYFMYYSEPSVYYLHLLCHAHHLD